MKLDTRRARISAGELAYVDEGDGPAVLLIHGFPTSSHLWRDVVPTLSIRHRVIAPDLLGYGDSDKPLGAALDIRAQAGYLRELLAELQIPDVAVVGHDVGGGIAQLLALDDHGVRTLVLLDSISFDVWPVEGVRLLQQMADADMTPELAAQVVTLAFDLGMEHRELLAERDLDEFRRPFRDDPAALLRAARAIDGKGLEDTEDPMRALDTRTLIVWGEEDPYVPVAHAERLGEVLPGATVALLPGCSHFVIDDAPTTVPGLIVEYLRTHDLRESHAHAHEQGGPIPVDLGVSFQRPVEPPGFGPPSEDDR